MLNNRNLNADLHCHTTASDGSLPPAELVARAIEHGVELLAITDHDNFDGFAEAQQAAVGKLPLISGIELSAVGHGMTIHIVGLDFDLELMQPVVERQKAAREMRNEKIAERLEKKGVKNVLEGAKRFATNDSILGRPQFAKYMVAEGWFKTEADAFKQWLGAGKIGDVKANWPDVETVVADIINAGGHAVLAHPHHYKMTNRKLGIFLSEFKAFGGNGIEVCVAGMKPDQIAYMALLCQKHELMASRASDFHSPSPWVELGRIPALPRNVEPIWQLFR